MASRRMLATSISVSEQVAALRDDFTRLLFTWMIAHADDWGVLTGSAAKVKALVLPMSDHSMSEVEAALADMEAHELIWRYNGPDGRPWVQFRTWEEHQSGLHKRTAPKVPRYADISGNSTEPTGYRKELPGTSGNVRELPSEQNRTEQNRESNDSLVGADATDEPTKPSSRKPRSKTVFDEDSKAMRLAQYLKAKCLAFQPDWKAPRDLQGWAYDCDKLLRVDGREYEHIKLVMDFAKGDSFWHDVIWSPSSVRKNWPLLDAKRRTNSQPLKATGTNGRAAPPEPHPLPVSRGIDLNAKPKPLPVLP